MLDRKWALARQILEFRKAARELSAAVDRYMTFRTPTNRDDMHEANERFKELL